MSMASLLEQVTNEHTGVADRCDVDVTADRFGCGATSEQARRACSLYLWLLGNTTEQLAATCPCKQ